MEERLGSMGPLTIQLPRRQVVSKRLSLKEQRGGRMIEWPFLGIVNEVVKVLDNSAPVC